MDRSPVSAAVAAATIVVTASVAGAQAGATSPPPRIEDNSFLIEEAYNQERGVVQHISTFSTPRGGGPWEYTFTQEWPVAGRAHQLSYTLPVEANVGRRGAAIGDVALNYRYQLAVGEHGGPAVAPRATLLLPTGRVGGGHGAGHAGVQVNLPVSYAVSDRLITHTNLGATVTPSARNASGDRATTRGYNAGQSAIWLLRPTLNVMLELAWSSAGEVTGPAARIRTSSSLLLAPGVRGAINLPSGLQVVPGLAVPIGLGPSRGERELFVYLSFEHAFARN